MSFARETVFLERLNEMAPEELLAWAYAEHGRRAGIVTSFQNTGCVMIDMARRVAPKMRVLTVDTLRLHRETYELIDRIEAHYGIGVERFKPDPDRLARMIEQHGEYLFFDGRLKQEYCCQVRKVEPNRRALATVDVWITGLRRDQSPGRADTDKAAWVRTEGREILRVCPLVDWTDERMAAYIADHDVPRNALYGKGYASIGCEICSTPTLAREDKRAGRWRWFNHLGDGHSKECGIHKDGSGI